MSVPNRVELGHMHVVMTHIYPGYESAWNRWYEDDHFYAGGVLAPSVLSGARWYASRSLRRARYFTENHIFKDPTIGGALATYALAAPDGPTQFRKWILPVVKELRAQGRMWDHRDVLNADFYRYLGCQRGPGASSIAPQVAQEHPWAGLLLTFAHGVPSGDDVAVEGLPANSVTLAFVWEVLPPHSPVGPDLSAHAPLAMFMTFMKEAPPDSAVSTAKLARKVTERSGLEPTWAGGYLPIVAGDASFLADF